MSAAGFTGYLRHLVIDSRPDPRPFAAVARPWQWEDAARLGPALESVAGVRRDYGGPHGFWRTRPRGCDKTTSIARAINWLLCYSRRHLSIIAAAGDRDQARLIRDAMLGEARLNPHVKRRLTFRANEVTGPGGRLEILAADAATGFGGRPDVTICDELTHWRKPDLWYPLLSAWRKRPGGVMLVITNAGIVGSWQDGVRTEVISDPDWDVQDVEGRPDTWMSETDILRDCRLLPEVVSNRVFFNRWSREQVNTVWTEEAWAKATQARYDVLSDVWPLEIGCDVGRFGDDATAIHVRRGPCSIHHETHRGLNTRQTADRLKWLCLKHSPKSARSVAVKIDSTGVGGGVVDSADGFNFIGVDAAARAFDGTSFPRLRDELWFRAFGFADEGVLDLSRLPPDMHAVLKGELFAPTFSYDAQGRRCVEAKADTKKRLKRSPDNADAFNLSYYVVPRVRETAT